MRFLPVPDRASCARVASLTLWLFLVVPAIDAAHACVVGDPALPVDLILTETPPDCCYGTWAGSLHGIVANVVTEDVVVVLYAQTDLYYVQPVVGATIEVGCTGVFSSPTHGGARYAAVVARRSWQPPAQMSALPTVEGDVLAVASAPDTQRRIEFAGHTWVVKSTGSVPFGPGPNLWSDASDAVWVDSSGRLHLRITERDGTWYSAEIFSEEYVGHGRYQFDVEGALDALDPNAVFAGFFYSDQGDEADIEFSRWGDPERASNAQFVVQPDAIHPWVTPSGSHHSMQFDWSANRIEFAAWSTDAGSPQPVAHWSHTGTVPTPDVERMRFNLWLFGAPPTDGREVEVIVSSYAYGTPTDVRRATGSRIAVTAAQMSRGSVEYVIHLARAGETRLRVLDPRGRLVERLDSQYFPSGPSHGVWRSGRGPVPSGVYFLEVRSGAERAAARFVFLR